MRKPDASVPRRALDDGAPRAQQAALLGVAHDVQRGAVFDAAARILELGFAEDGAGGFGGEGREVDQGRVADGAAEAGDDALGGRDAEGVGGWGGGGGGCFGGGGGGGGGVEAAGVRGESAHRCACWRRHWWRWEGVELLPRQLGLRNVCLGELSVCRRNCVIIRSNLIFWRPGVSSGSNARHFLLCALLSAPSPKSLASS